MSTPTFIIYGAAGGIGSEVARQLIDEGYRVILVGRGSRRLSELSDELSCPKLEVDVSDVDSVERVAREVLEEHGRIDGMANCAGSLLLKPAHLTSAEDWQSTIDANLGTAFSVVRAAAKAGVIGLVLSASATYASRGLRFNAVAPGLVKTPMTERLTSSESATKASEQMHAAGRLGEPGDVARMIAWLLDPQQSWVTGQVFGIDGGLATVRTRRP